MTYSKPEIAVLGNAVRVIQGVKQDTINLEPDQQLGFVAAYDLDE